MKGSRTKKSLSVASLLVAVTMLAVPCLRQWWCIPPLYVAFSALLMARFQYQMHIKLQGFPSPDWLPVIGHMHILQGTKFERFQRARYLRAKFGSRFIINVLNEFSANLSDADSVEVACLLVVATLVLVDSVREWWSILLLLIAYLAATFGWYQHRKRVQLRGFASPNSLPLLGHMGVITTSRLNTFRALRKVRAQYGTRVWLHIVNVYGLNFSDADSVEVMLSCTKNLTKGQLYSLLHPWLGQGLLTSTGEHWARHRKLLTPAFHFSILEKLSVRLQFHSETFAETLEELLQTEPEEAVNLMPHIAKTTLSAILEVAMGVDLKEAGDGYVKAIYAMGDLICDRIARPWLWNDFVYSLLPGGKRLAHTLKLLHGFSSKVITERKAFLQTRMQESNLPVDNEENEIGIRKKLAFLDILLTAQMNGEEISDEDIRNQVDTFMFEGHDTTAMGIYWTLYLLADHPEIQEHLREEVNSVSLEDAPKLPYLDRVIREALRLYPSVPFFSRQIEHPIKFGETQVVHPPMSVHVHVYDLHRDPEQFPDPLRFDPDRKYPTHPFAYIPFSGGSRNCIGRRLALLELKFMVAATLRRIRLRKPPISHFEVPIPIDLVLRPGIPIKIPLELIVNTNSNV